MNPLSSIGARSTLVGPHELISLASLANGNRVYEFHALGREFLNEIAQLRALLTKHRSEFAASAAWTRDELETSIDALEKLEAELSARRQAMMRRRDAVKSRIRRGRLHLRPTMGRVTGASESIVVDVLEMLRDERFQWQVELATREHEPVGPIMTSPQVVSKYFSSIGLA